MKAAAVTTFRSPLAIRLATPRDAVAVQGIYRPSIEKTAASFEYDVPTIAELEDRIQSYTKTCPWLIGTLEGCGDEDDTVVGYAYAAPFHKRTAYQWSVEVSVYIHKDYHRQGIARELYDCLFQLLKVQGFCNVYAGITVPNPASESLHEASFGFKRVGCFANVGYKFNQWHNVAWFQKVLQDAPDDPEPPLTMEALQLTDEWKTLVR